MDDDLRRREINHLALWVMNQSPEEQIRWANNQGPTIRNEVRERIRKLKSEQKGKTYGFKPQSR
jgi:hypothetical protein